MPSARWWTLLGLAAGSPSRGAAAGDLCSCGHFLREADGKGRPRRAVCHKCRKEKGFQQRGGGRGGAHAGRVKASRGSAPCRS